MPGEREWKMAFRLRCEQQAEAGRSANRVPPPKPIEPPTPAASTALPAPRSLPDGPLLAPKLRPDAAERRHSYRRAEDLLLD